MIKKFFFFAFAIFSACSFYAQIAIERSDYYDVGTVIPTIIKDDTIPKSDLLNNDSLIISGFTNQHLQEELNFYDKADFSSSNEFPTATLGYYQFFSGQEAVFYERITEEEAVILGMQMIIPMVGSKTIVFDSALIMKNFPQNYSTTAINSESSGEFRFPISDISSMIPSGYESLLNLYDTIRGVMDISKTSVYDDFGEIILAGNYLEVDTYDYLRENRVMTFIFNMQLRNKLTGSWSNLGPILTLAGITEIELPMEVTTNSLLYWTKGKEYPIAEITLSEDTTQITKISARCDNTNTNSVENYEIVSLAYPNPAKTFFYINEENSNIKSISLYSISGQKIKEEKFVSNEINISELSRGIYYYKIKYSDDNIKVGKIIKE